MPPAIAAALALLLLTLPATAQSLKPDEVLTGIAVTAIDPPNPVLGADDRVHLAYELLVSNVSKDFLTLDSVTAVDGEGKSLGTLDGARLAAMTQLYAGSDRTLPPGGTAVVFMDVTFAKGAALPGTVAARIAATRQSAGADGKPAPMPADGPLPAKFTFTGAAIAVGKPAIVLAPPLRGSGWVAVNGCCDAITAHRGAVLPVNGTIRVPERFAIDWVKLDGADRLFTGDIAKLGDYAFYGTPVHAAADGVVVNLYDETGEQVPGSDTKGITPQNIGGNMVVVDIGGGAYAFYAHLQRGSLKVKLGDKVKTGEVLGLLGNTGNSTAPHLHFHVMDGTSPLDANSLPYVFTRFTGLGVMTDPDSPEHPFVSGKPAQIDAKRLAGPHRDQLPLNNQVVAFD